MILPFLSDRNASYSQTCNPMIASSHSGSYGSGHHHFLLSKRDKFPMDLSKDGDNFCFSVRGRECD